MPFQTVVNNDPAPAVEGDLASANPRSSILAGPGGLVAGPFGVTVGRFLWVDPDFRTANSFGSAPAAPDGFLYRNMQGLIQNYLQEYSMIVPAGFQIAGFKSGDFWARNLGPAALTKGATVYAGYADGGIYSSAPTGAAATASLGSTNTAAIGSTSTGTVVADNPNQITLSSLTGVVSVGDTVTGTGVPLNTVITAQISGTTGAAGVYETNNQTTAAAATITTFGEILVVSATTALISVGDTVSGGAGFPVGAVVVRQLPGGTVGGAGQYQLSAPATEYVASATGVTTFGNVIKVTAVASGTLAPGVPITGTNMPATSIASQISGTPGGVGVYSLVTPGTQYVASESITTAGGIASGWIAEPTEAGDGSVGALIKITRFQ